MLKINFYFIIKSEQKRVRYFLFPIVKIFVLRKKMNFCFFILACLSHTDCPGEGYCRSSGTCYPNCIVCFTLDDAMDGTCPECVSTGIYKYIYIYRYRYIYIYTGIYNSKFCTNIIKHVYILWPECTSHDHCEFHQYCDRKGDCWDPCSDCVELQDGIGGTCPDCIGKKKSFLKKKNDPSSPSSPYRFYFFISTHFWGFCISKHLGKPDEH